MSGLSFPLEIQEILSSDDPTPHDCWSPSVEQKTHFNRQTLVFMELL